MRRNEEEQLQLDCRRPTLASVYAMTWALHDIEAEILAGGVPVPVLLDIEAEATADYIGQLRADLARTQKIWLTAPTLRGILDAIDTHEALNYCSGGDTWTY